MKKAKNCNTTVHLTPWSGFYNAGRFLSVATCSLLVCLAPVKGGTTRFAIIGDFDNGVNAKDVATQVIAQNPDFVVTVGDNNYSSSGSGSTANWDLNVGTNYANFIKYPAGSTSFYAPGAPTNRFFICLGNHDWDVGISSYTNYFDLPGAGISGSGNTDGTERFYDFIRGNVHFFIVDSDPREYSGTNYNQTQGLWLSNRLAASSSPWKFVFFHHPPFATTPGDQRTNMRWPFREWGADAVFVGHVHNYERIMLNGFPYVIAGNSGRPLDSFGSPAASGSVFRYNTDQGFVIAEVSECSAIFSLTNVHSPSAIRDTFTLTKPSPTSLDVAVAWGADDGEENDAGAIDITSSSDLEMINDAGDWGADQVVGMRFNRVTIPRGATVSSAYVQFTAKDATSASTTLKIHGQGSAPMFTTASFNISSRIDPTKPSVTWSSVPSWTAGAAGVDQRTPDLSSIIQNIVDQSSWAGGALGNSLAILVTNGVSGSTASQRRAWSYNGNAAASPVLHLDWTAAGKIDYSFDPGTGLNAGNYAVCAVQTDGKIVVGGVFTSVNGVSRTKVARFQPNGALDASFAPSITGGNVYCLTLQPDGKILIGGDFTSAGGYARLARLNSDGSVDNNLVSYGPSAAVWSLAVQSDGKILAGGYFTNLGTSTRADYIARFDSSGNVDTSFIQGTGYYGANGGVLSIAVQSDGKIVIGGGFTWINGYNRGGIARLNSDGSVDTGFATGSGFSGGTVSTVALQSDGKVLVGGGFTTYSGTSQAYLARLNSSDGSLDTGFGPSLNLYVYSVLPRADGKVYATGQFTTAGGTTRNRFARLNSNGSLDTSFDPGTALTGSYGWDIKEQPCDGKVIVVGSFSAYNGVSRNCVVRAHGY